MSRYLFGPPASVRLLFETTREMQERLSQLNEQGKHKGKHKASYGWGGGANGTTPLTPAPASSPAPAPSPWYESDALFAWNSSLDTSTAQMNPDGPGNAISISSGTSTDVTVANGLWNPGAAAFTSTTGMFATADTATNPLLLVQVANRGSLVTAGSSIILRVGGFPLLQVLASGADTQFQYHNGASAQSVIAGSLEATTRAYWFFFDPAANKMNYGYNQIVLNTNATAGEAPAHSFPGSLTPDLWFDNNSWNRGSTEILNRSGLGVTAALAIVQKVQNVHGI